MYAHHAIRSKFMDQLRARSRRLQPFDCVELFPFFDDCREKVSASEKHEDRHVERIDAKRALEGLAARGMDIEAAIGRREQNPYSREKWGIE
jgi:DNA-directed RNA polymerase specialized sigma24 family protein